MFCSNSLGPARVDRVERRLLQDQRLDDVRGVEGELQGHHSAPRVRDDVRLLDPENLEQRKGVVDVDGDARFAVERVAAGEPATVIAEEAVRSASVACASSGRTRSWSPRA